MYSNFKERAIGTKFSPDFLTCAMMLYSITSMIPDLIKLKRPCCQAGLQQCAQVGETDHIRDECSMCRIRERGCC